MIEKPSKDGKPPTVEYQEEEILVGIFLLNLLYYYKKFPLKPTHTLVCL